MTLPALLGGGRGGPDGADVVQSCVAHDGWHEMTSPEAEVPRLSRDDFASLVAHELRNPLNALVGWLHLLAAEPGPASDAARRAIGGMRRALDQQVAQVETLRQVLRLREGGPIDASAPVELGSLLAECASGLRAAANAAGRDVEVVRETDEPAWITGDAEALRVALQALGAFAIRHGAPGAALRMGVAPGAAPLVDLSIDEGDDGGLSIWHGFGRAGTRLPLELLHATLVLEAHGARVGPTGDGRVGDALAIRFHPSTAAAAGASASARPHA